MVFSQHPQFARPAPVTPIAPVDPLEGAILTITKKGQSLAFDLETKGFAHSVLQNLDFEGSANINQLAKRMRVSPKAIRPVVNDLIRAKGIAITRQKKQGFMR